MCNRRITAPDFSLGGPTGHFLHWRNKECTSEKGNTIFEKLGVAVLCTLNLNIADAARTSVSLGPKRMMTAGSLTFWFLQDSGELRWFIHPAPLLEAATGCLHSSATAQCSSASPLHATFLPPCQSLPFIPRKTLLLAPEYHTVFWGSPVPYFTL